VALGPRGYTGVIETTEHGGYPLLHHLKRTLASSVAWTPGLDGAVVLSQRCGDFLLHVGQDLSIGYSQHDADTVSLYARRASASASSSPMRRSL